MRTPEEQLVDASLEIGKALLLAGGEVTRVEDTITRILHAYGMREIGVFTITSLIEVTACTPDGDEIVKARRIAGSYATDLDRVERLNALSREICAQCPPPQTLAARIEAIRRPRTEAAWISYAGAVLTACSFAVFFVIGLTCMKPYFYAQTSDPVIAQQGIRYLSVCCIFSLGLFTQTMGEKLLAATGRTYLSMISQLVGAVVNIILDPIFIFGYCGEALSGTTGAAVATVIGQFCGAGMTLYFNTRKNPDIQISFKGFRPSAKAIGRIYTVGLPSIAMQCVGSLMTFGMNLILMAFSATAVAVFGVYFKLQSFVFMPIFGLNNGMVPIISYNYGARRPNRVKKTIKLAVCYAEGIMLAGFCIFQFAPRQVLSIFAASDAMLAIGIPAMRIICLHFLLAGVSIVLSSVFQALGNGVFSLIVSVCRQLFVLLPAAWLLAQTGSVNNVWWAFLIAEVVSILMSLAFYARINKTTIAPLYH